MGRRRPGALRRLRQRRRVALPAGGRGAGAARPGDAAGRAESGHRPGGRRARPSRPRPGIGGRRAAPAGAHGRGHGAPPAARRRRRPADQHQSPPPRAARAGGPPLGRRAHALADPPPRPHGRRRTPAAGRHLPRVGRRGQHPAGRSAGRPTALGRRDPPADLRAGSAGHDRVRAAGLGLRARRRVGRSGRRGRRSHPGQPVPGLRAVADAGRVRCSRDGWRAAPDGAVDRSAVQPGERARGGQPAAAPARPRHDGAARGGRRRRPRVRPGHDLCGRRGGAGAPPARAFSAA